MKISVAMILLNDSENVGRALISADFADEIVIIDGGSTDSSIQRVNKFISESEIPVKIYTHIWPNDFSIQRNVSFSKCTGDWIIRLDSDEMFGIHLRSAIRPFLEESPEEALSIRIRQNNIINENLEYAANLGGWESHPRIFRNTGTLNWVGHVHEWVENVDHKCVDWNVCVNHFGWINLDKLKEKEQRYINTPGSGFETEGSLVNRHYEVRKFPLGVF